MMQNKEFNISDKIKEIGIGNVLLIAVFLICLIYFVIYSIIFYTSKLFNNKVDIYYDYNNSIEYSVDSENDFYKTELVTSNSIFYNIEDIIEVIISNLKNQKYDTVASIFSNDAKRNLKFSENQIEDKLKEFSEIYISNDKKCELTHVYYLNNTNIYICKIKNSNGEEKQITLNVDFEELTYKIENFEF